jgi:hypothetical protein
MDIRIHHSRRWALISPGLLKKEAACFTWFQDRTSPLETRNIMPHITPFNVGTKQRQIYRSA